MTDHVRGEGTVELTQFADFECPYCRDAAPSIRRVLERMDGRVRLRFRHFPIVARHPHAVRAAVAAEAAGARLDPRVGPLLERAVLFGEVPRGEVPELVGTSDRQARRLVKPLTDRGLLTGAKDAPLRVMFPLGETERLFPHLWAPSGAPTSLAPMPEIEEALRLP